MRPIVVYDDTCGMCRRSVRWVRRLDWLRRLDDMGYSVAVQRYPEIGRGALGDGLRVRFPDGRVALGVDAVRAIAIRTPLGALGAWTLYVRGLHALGARGYAEIARRRRPEGAACPLPDRYARGAVYETT
ncbi:MAG: thiol-disulfide oxidoreductase DCC family protein [Gaiellales bacterium]